MWVYSSPSPLDRVLFIECEKHRQVIHLAKQQETDVEETMVIHDVMSHLDEVTAPGGFRFVHKGHIVNLRKVQTILSDDVTLLDGTFIPVSRKKIGDSRNSSLRNRRCSVPCFARRKSSNGCSFTFSSGFCSVFSTKIHAECWSFERVESFFYARTRYNSRHGRNSEPFKRLCRERPYEVNAIETMNDD